MKTILALLFIIISISNFVSKQTKEQTRRRTQEPRQEENPYAEPRPQPEAYKMKQVQPNQTRQSTASQKQRVNQPKPKAKEQAVNNAANRRLDNGYNEGLEFEDRNKTGSLAYAEQDSGTEGRGHAFGAREQERGFEPDGMKVSAEDQREIGDLLAFSSEDMFRSIVMAEILGTPRSIKRNIR